MNGHLFTHRQTIDRVGLGRRDLETHLGRSTTRRTTKHVLFKELQDLGAPACTPRLGIFDLGAVGAAQQLGQRQIADFRLVVVRIGPLSRGERNLEQHHRNCEPRPTHETNSAKSETICA